MRKLLAVAALLAVLLGTLVGAPGSAQTYVGRAPAPEFPPGLNWINTDRELTLEELRGKIVLLDYHTPIRCQGSFPQRLRSIPPWEAGLPANTAFFDQPYRHR